MSTIDQLRKYFEGRRLIIPIGLGLLVSAYLFYKDFDINVLLSIEVTGTTWIWLAIAALMMAFRDLGYIIRLRILSDKLLNFKQSFQITFLWEFVSAISPGMVGGTAAAFVLLAQEKIGTGRSTAIVLATSFLDVLFYVISLPLVVLFTGLYQHIPEVSLTNNFVDRNFILGYVLVAYIILLVWAIVVFVGLFLKPNLTRTVIVRMFKLPLLKRWKDNAETWGDEVVQSAHELNAKGFKFWLSAFGATVFSWTARFAVVNFLIIAFGANPEHMSIYIRQLIMWCILILPVTPGASGLAEALFPAFLGKFFANLSIAKVCSIVWRLLSYYPYLLIGFILFPLWLKRIIKSRKVV